MPAAPLLLHNDRFHVLLPNDLIESRIGELGHKISEDYQGLHPVFIIVLNGAFMFAASLMKHVSLTCETDFIRISSYASKESTGKVFELLGLQEDLEGRDLIVLEDIVDTGLSMRFLINELIARRPASVKIASLLYKPTALKEPVYPDYVGFEIEDRFVVGYGLDYDGLGRNYPDLYVIAEN